MLIQRPVLRFVHPTLLSDWPGSTSYVDDKSFMSDDRWAKPLRLVIAQQSRLTLMAITFYEAAVDGQSLHAFTIAPSGLTDR